MQKDFESHVSILAVNKGRKISIWLFLGFISCLLFNSVATASAFKTDRLGVEHNLKIGDTIEYTPESYRVTLKKIHREDSKCAVPGKNCGVGYVPYTQAVPEFEIASPKGCEAAVIPESCSVVHRAEILGGGETVKVWFVKFQEVCNATGHPSNYDSCIFQIVTNSHDKPPRHPKHCDLIKNPHTRDKCVQFIAEKISDHTVCDLMKGPMGFPCVLMKAKAAKNPELCRGLKKGLQHNSDQDWKDQIEFCLKSAKNQ